MFSGIGVSRGVAIGKAVVLTRDAVDVSARTLEKSELAAEVRRLKRALKVARTQLLTARATIPKDAPSDVSAFIETHILMLDDSLLVQRPAEIIRSERLNAEAALDRQKTELTRVFGEMEDDYLSTRIDDVRHVIDSVIRALDASDAPEQPGVHWSGRIVVADDLTPADTVTMQHHGVAGFVTETGGQLSHTAILARSLGIPAIVGVHGFRRWVKPGETLTVDGASGMVLAEPTEAMLETMRDRQKAMRQDQRELKKLIDTASVSADGTPFTLMANLEVDEDMKALRRVKAAGVGLYRTEFLYLGRDRVPSEQEHHRVYVRMLRSLKGATLTVRTVDLGADKVMEGRAAIKPGPLARNPALGLRGIRLCLSDTTLFVPQLRAILRASARGPLRILLPMLTNLEEVHQCLALIEEVRAALRDEGIAFDEHIPIGGMIEVPAAAVQAAAFAQALDFLSIGTNDLIQYTLAIDRIDDQVNYLYDPLHPAVLSLIRTVIDAGRAAGTPVAMCGEMAGDPRYVRLLFGLGLTEFSMPPNLLLQTKRSLLGARRPKLRRQALAFLNTDTPAARLELLERINA